MTLFVGPVTIAFVQYIVYRAVNEVNGKSYVGFTERGLAVRRREHEHQAGAGKSDKCRVFAAALRKYGAAAFSWSILGAFEDRDVALAAEAACVAAYNARVPGGYNLRAGGTASQHSSETRKLMSDAAKGKQRTAEHCANLAAACARSPAVAAFHVALRGRKLTQEHRANISAVQKGKTRSEEHKAAIGDALRGVPKSEATRAAMRLAAVGRRPSREACSKGGKTNVQPVALSPAQISVAGMLLAHGAPKTRIGEWLGVSATTVANALAGKFGYGANRG